MLLYSHSTRFTDRLPGQRIGYPHESRRHICALLIIIGVQRYDFFTEQQTPAATFLLVFPLNLIFLPLTSCFLSRKCHLHPSPHHSALYETARREPRLNFTRPTTASVYEDKRCTMEPGEKRTKGKSSIRKGKGCSVLAMQANPICEREEEV